MYNNTRCPMCLAPAKLYVLTHMISIKNTLRNLFTRSVLRTGELRHRGLSILPKGNRARKQPSRNANPDSLASESESSSMSPSASLKDGDPEVEEAMTVSLRARRIQVFLLSSTSAEPNAPTRVTSGNLDIQTPPKPKPKGAKPPALAAETGRTVPSQPGTAHLGTLLFVPSTSPTPAAKTLPPTLLHLAAPGRQPQTPCGGEASPSSQQLLGHAGAGRHLLGTTRRPTRPGMPADPR